MSTATVIPLSWEFPAVPSAAQERRAESALQAEFEAERDRVIASISTLDAADLACDDEFAALLRRETVTANEVGRWLLAARNKWADDVAARVVA